VKVLIVAEHPSNFKTLCKYILTYSILRWGIVSLPPKPQAAGGPPLVGCEHLFI